MKITIMDRQVTGFVIGQKYAPLAACFGAGIVERLFHNMPRDVVFDHSPGIMSRDKEQGWTKVQSRSDPDQNINDLTNETGKEYGILAKNVIFWWINGEIQKIHA